MSVSCTHASTVPRSSPMTTAPARCASSAKGCRRARRGRSARGCPALAGMPRGIHHSRNRPSTWSMRMPPACRSTCAACRGGDERRVGERVGAPRRLRPVLAHLVVHVRRRTDGDVLWRARRAAPARVGALGCTPGRRGRASRRWPCRPGARRPAPAELLVEHPLAPAVELDLVGQLGAGGLGGSPARVGELLGPVVPARRARRRERTTAQSRPGRGPRARGTRRRPPGVPASAGRRHHLEGGALIQTGSRSSRSALVFDTCTVAASAATVLRWSVGEVGELGTASTRR